MVVLHLITRVLPFGRKTFDLVATVGRLHRSCLQGGPLCESSSAELQMWAWFILQDDFQNEIVLVQSLLILITCPRDGHLDDFQIVNAKDPVLSYIAVLDSSQS